MNIITKNIYKLAFFLQRISVFLLRSSKSDPFFNNCHGSAKVIYSNIYKKQNTSLSIGEKSIVEAGIFFERENSSVVIGSRTFIGASSIMCAEKVIIGDDILISFGVTIADHDSHSLYFKQRKKDVSMWYNGEKDWSTVSTAPVMIADKSWIGMHVIILKGVTIGEGAVVGAGSIVTQDVPPYTLVAGNPARVIRKLGSA